MSTEMASSICVGTSTTISHQNNSSHSQKVIVPSDFSEKSANTDVKKDDRVTTFNANVAVVADMDLVNGPNPWLPAYGFQLQQHVQHFQPTHEDLRANDPAIPQQGDFLETILEETSDDLQSDSDRSGTTYWLGSDSETESVIHIKANQRAAEERPDGSGSECNSVVPKKRRRRNASKDRDATLTLSEDHWASPRSSRSSESSSRSSSLLQFESLERTCATVSPSGYSYDSLEYSNRSNTRFENTSPDSLEEDCDEDSRRLRNPRSNTGSNGSTFNGRNGFGNLRPYRSFESLDTCHKNDDLTSNDLTNGFSTSFYSKTSNDLTAGAIKNDRGHRDFWHENYEEEEYEYEDEEEEEEEDDDEDDEDTLVNRDSRIYDPYESRGGNFGSSNLGESNLGNYSTSLDYRNTTDLREIGLSRTYDFKTLQQQQQQQQQGSPLCSLVNSASSRMLQSTRLNIAGVEEEEEEERVRGGVSTGCISNKMASSNDSVTFLQHHHHHHSHSHNHSHNSHQNERGWSSESLGFKFRTTVGGTAEKCLSAPSLGSDVEDSISRCYAFGRGPRSSGASFGTVSSTDLFENYTRVASVPVDLNLCGKNEELDNRDEENEEEDVTLTNDDNILDNFEIKSHKMADDSVLSEQSSCESTSKSLLSDKEDSSSPCHSDEKTKKVSVVRTSSVRTQIRPEIAEVNPDLARGKPSQRSSNSDPESSAKMKSSEASSSEPEDEDTVLEDEIPSLTRDPEPPKSTVKTQDRGGNNVLEMALAMENDIDAVVDEAIRQFKREVEEATGSGNETAILALEAVQRLGSEKQQQQRAARRVKNNASYELAQQFEVNENNFLHTGRMSSCLEDDAETATPSSPTNSGRRRVLNNASYELAQQTDYMKLLQKNSRPFHRMDACDERPEVPRPGITCGEKVADIVREMSKDPGTSSLKDSTMSNQLLDNERKIEAENKQRSSGRYHDNHVANSPGKNYESGDGESMIGQIKKNSDPFLLYGESGKGMGRTLGSVEAEIEEDDEVDYPCLEIKSIIETSASFPGDVSRPLGRRKSNERWENDEISTSFNEESLAQRGLTFLGDFYPETNNHLARGAESPGKESEKHQRRNDVEPLASDVQRKQRFSSSTCSASPSCSSSASSSGSPTSTSSSACKSESLESEERGTLEYIESVHTRETTVSPPSSVLEGEKEEKSTPMEKEEEEASSSNVLELEKEKEAKRSRRRRRKECAYVETGGPNSAASCVHALTPATSSPPRPVTSHAVYSDDSNEIKLKERLEPDDYFADRILNDSADDNKIHQQLRTLVDEENDREFEKQENTKKTTRNNAEMSATAAKRLAMASGPPRNNNEPSNNINKSELEQSKNIHLGSPVNERKKSGLGGFLQRFSRLRFSGRSKVPRSEINKKFNSESTSVEPFNSNRRSTNTVNDQQTNTARRKEPDYIIIPLHAPDDESNKIRSQDEQDFDYKNRARRTSDLERSASCASPNGRPLVSSKPPLPPSHQQSGISGGGGSSSSSSSVGARSTGATMTGTTRCVSGAGGVVGNTRRRAATDLGSPAAIEMAKARAMQAAQEPRPVGLLETDLDAAEPAIRHVNLNTINGASATSHPHNNSHISTSNNQPGKKTRSLLNLNHTSARQGREVHHHLNNENELRVPHSPTSANRNNSEHHQDHHNSNQRPHKSMEFLLDKENLHFVKPPENELQKVGERVPSEHELRVQRSLQRLNVPDWYKNSPAARDGFRLKRHSDASQHSGWRSLGSKTTSLSSLSSSSNRQPTTGVLLSPSPTPPVFSRWSTSLLNSAGSSPASSARSSFNHRQPYLGWRSQERLANPRTPAERLAQGILPQLQSAKKQQQQQQQQQQTNQQLEVRNSIKEVTSAIVHYVQSGQEVAGGGRLSPRPRPDDWDDRGGARSTSPRGSVKLCWMESSFVGSRPVDSPETPMSLATDTECCAGCNATGTESCSCVDSATSGLYLDLTPTRDEPQRHRGGPQQQQHQQQQLPQVQQHGSRSQCPSPSPTLNYHQPIHHHVHQQQQQQHRHHRGSGQSEDEEAMATAALLRNKPSPGSTTLEDVLDSLLGLPSASRTPSPGPGPISASTSIRHQRTSNTGSPAGQTTNTKAGKSCSDLRQDLQESVRVEDDNAAVKEVGGSRGSPYYVGELVRRKSEGSDIVPPHRSSSRGSNVRNRRVSFDAAQQNNGIENNGLGIQLGEKLVRCRNNKCNNATSVAEARRIYKSCHNCTCLYCSRECRRAHWQRHRRTCLHSRAGTLCRQVLSSAKEDSATLKHISALAQRGYASHGRGAVKCFFTSPEIAEQFVSNGFVDLGEPTYVKWSELLPSEMGAELYAEVIRLCKSYNPETRLVLYVAVCVVSEVPSSGAVRWERQLVSRCGKIRLDTSCRQPSVIPPASNTASPGNRTGTTSPCNITREMDSPETLVLTSMPGTDGQNTPRSSREIGFTNIQRQLRLRGVSLRRHFPQVYTKLCSYVDGTVDKFAPVTIYPRDQASGKSFMCIIMLDAEPERLQLLPTDSSRVRTVDISVEQE